MNENEVIIKKGITKNDEILLSIPEDIKEDYKLVTLSSKKK
jgi:hypothetical protein